MALLLVPVAEAELLVDEPVALPEELEDVLVAEAVAEPDEAAEVWPASGAVDWPSI